MNEDLKISITTNSKSVSAHWSANEAKAVCDSFTLTPGTTPLDLHQETSNGERALVVDWPHTATEPTVEGIEVHPTGAAK